MAEPSSDQTSGSVFVGFGLPSVVRIPIPGTNGLAVELRARNFKGSTSVLFFQDVEGKRVLRLDHGWNKTTQTVDYHWNQDRVYKDFRIEDHTPLGPEGELIYNSARVFKYAGTTLLVLGAAADIYSIVVAKKRLRQAVKVAAGWGGAWAGCEVIGPEGAAALSELGPLGMAAGGLGGCAVGSIAGYNGASLVAGGAYDVVEEIYYETIPEAGRTGSGGASGSW